MQKFPTSIIFEHLPKLFSNCLALHVTLAETNNDGSLLLMFGHVGDCQFILPLFASFVLRLTRCP